MSEEQTKDVAKRKKAAQRKEFADPSIVEDLVHYFCEKKRLTIKNYTYNPSNTWDDYFKEAAVLCADYELPPSTYIQKMYERMEPKVQFFTPEHIRGEKVEALLKSWQSQGETSYVVEITNANLDYRDLWEHQENLARRLLRPDETYEELMLDSSLKFFGWFRILSTEERNMKIIEKYRHIARKEMTQALKDFIVQNGLDLDRFSI
jgi:hypothetical protein